jgi:hypothetical protein
MRLTAPGLLLLASAAFAGVMERVDGHLAKGAKALEAANGVEGMKLLRALEAAKPHFKRARALAARGLEGAPGDAALAKAQADATQRLVGILNAETMVYLSRGARTLAGKRNGEALKLLPEDSRAKELKDAIENPAPYEFDAQMVDSVLGGLAGKPASRHEADRRFGARR